MTTIKVLFIMSDSEYCRRIASYFNKHHPEIKLTLVAAKQDADEGLSHGAYNVVLIGEEFAAAGIVVPEGSASAYFCEDHSKDEVGGMRAFCKYQSGETLYKIIISLFSEVSNIKQLDSHANKIYAFVGANGGAGATTIAASFAYKQAMLGKKTLYFCIDQFADFSGLFYDNTGRGTMEDLIFIVKSEQNMGTAALKAAALLKKDSTGVNFIELGDDPAAFNGLTTAELEKMLEVISGADSFDSIIIDANFNDEKSRELIIKKVGLLFIVSDKGVGVNVRPSKLINYLKLMNLRDSSDLISRSVFVVNKNDTQMPQGATYEGVTACSVPRYKDNCVRNIANAIARLNFWNYIQIR